VTTHAGSLERRVVAHQYTGDASSIRETREPLVIYVSPLLESHGFVHGFSTRRGGVSRAALGSLNLGLCAGISESTAVGGPFADESARIEVNTQRFLHACGLGGHRPARVRQVHGAGVAEGGLDDIGPVDADAVLVRRPGVAAMVRTADCVPVLIAAPSLNIVSAVHAGWRGIIAGVLEASVERLCCAGARPEELLAAIGPSIGVDAYEVGDDVAAEFARRDLRHSIRPGPRKAHVDCHHAARAILMRCGLAPDRIEGEPICTFANDGEFFSARRDGPISGRLAATIATR
jgi:YfiH family protein